jgi:signal transduction histidine kinase
MKVANKAGGHAMSKNIIRGAFVVAAFLLAATIASAQQSGSAEEAKAMLERAVAALKSDKSAALGQMNDKSNKQFHDRDLYVFCVTMDDGKLTTTANPALIGTDARALKAGDDPFGQRIYDAMKNTSPGSISTVDYKFPKPGTTEYVPKQSFVTRIGDQGCGVGYYK